MTLRPLAPKTVCLPSGRTFELGDRDLAICRECDSQLVAPTRWEVAGPAHWRLSLRCPNCLSSTEGLFSQACVDSFDERLDEGTMLMVTDLRGLAQENMRADCERFIAALATGAILPEDFEGGAR